MGMNSKKIKERAMEILESDEYQIARNEEFHIQFQNMFMKSVNTDFGSDFVIQGTLTEDDLTGFIDSFTFPDEEDYAMNKACNEADDYGDMKYQEMKDKRYEDD